MVRQARQYVGELMNGAGIPYMERGFAMTTTVCVHRVATPDEAALIPTWSRGSLAGPPGRRLLWVTENMPDAALSFDPCVKRYFVKHSSGATIPVDACGECPSCIHRTELLARTNERKNSND